MRDRIWPALLIAALAGTAEASADELKMGGTGATMMLLEKLGATCTQGSETKPVVIRGLSGSGGLRALADHMLDVSVVGRPLNAEETAKGLQQVAVVQTPYVLVTSHARPNGLKSADVAGIYGSSAPTWADGTAMRIILRPKGDSDTAILQRLFPGMAAALDTASKRPEVPVAATDQDNADLAENIAGSLTGASYIQIKTEDRNVRLVALDGVEPTPENLERGDYRYSRTLHFIVPTPRSPVAEHFLACMRSPAGLQMLRDNGGLLSKD